MISCDLNKTLYPLRFTRTFPIHMRIIIILTLAMVAVVQSSCHRKRSENPGEVYRLWAGERPPEDVKVLKGRYWQSAHFAKEYIVYMKIEAPREWIEEFIDLNKLKRETEDREIPSDAPDWFKPPQKDIVWAPSGFGNGSKYFIDSAFTHIFLYEVQL